jgi:hypothetical protein
MRMRKLFLTNVDIIFEIAENTGPLHLTHQLPLLYIYI